MMDNYNTFIKVIKKDPRVRNDFQSKIGYNSLIQNVIP